MELELPTVIYIYLLRKECNFRIYERESSCENVRPYAFDKLLHY